MAYSQSHVHDWCLWAWAECERNRLLCATWCQLVPRAWSCVMPAVVLHHRLVVSGLLLWDNMSWKKRATSIWLISVLGYECPFWMLSASLSEVHLPTASTSALGWALCSSRLWSSPSPVLLMLSTVLSFLFSFPASPRFFFLWHFSLPLPFRLPVSSPSRHFRQQEFQDTACSYILY